MNYLYLNLFYSLFLQSIDKPTQVFDSKTNHKIIDLINLLPMA